MLCHTYVYLNPYVHPSIYPSVYLCIHRSIYPCVFLYLCVVPGLPLDRKTSDV